VSPSVSVSPSLSPSASPSISPSISPSPSPGFQEYTRGDEAALPSDDTNLETDYSGGDITDVATKNDVRVSQSATSEYAIHQFKDYVGTEGAASLEWEGQTNCHPSLSTVYLQVYNTDTPEWETVDSDNSSAVNTDFTLSGNIADLTNYKDGRGVMSCRVYQEDL